MTVFFLVYVPNISVPSWFFGKLVTPVRWRLSRGTDSFHHFENERLVLSFVLYSFAPSLCTIMLLARKSKEKRTTEREEKKCISLALYRPDPFLPNFTFDPWIFVYIRMYVSRWIPWCRTRSPRRGSRVFPFIVDRLLYYIAKLYYKHTVSRLTNYR